MTHTPTPWLYDPKTGQIVTANGRIAAYVSGPFNQKGATVGTDIVRAVNALADFVAAMETIERLVTSGSFLHQIAIAALAKARGEPS